MTVRICKLPILKWQDIKCLTIKLQICVQIYRYTTNQQKKKKQETKTSNQQIILLKEKVINK